MKFFAGRISLFALVFAALFGSFARAAPREKTAPRMLFFSAWSGSIEDCRRVAETARKYNFDGVDFAVLWTKIEAKGEGQYDWKYLDECLDTFTSHGLKLSLSVMFWPIYIPWAEQLEMQQTAAGKPYVLIEPDGTNQRGLQLSLSDARNIAIIERTMRAFAFHTNQKYGPFIERFHARTSHYGELEWTPTRPALDRSTLAVAAFKKYLRREYSRREYSRSGLKVFNRNYHLSLKNWDELEAISLEALLARSPFDWQHFRLQTLLNLSRAVSRAIRAGAPGKKVALQVGAVWDESAAISRGTFDPYLLSRDVDILHTDDAVSWPHDFSLDLIGSIAEDRLTAMEIDGSNPQNEAEKYLRQAKMGGESAITYLNTANWTAPNIEVWGERVLRQYRPLFIGGKVRPQARQGVAILFNTADFIVRGKSLDTLLLATYQKLSDGGQKRVRFISDSQILARPEILKELKGGLYLGRADSFVFDPRVARVLAKSNCKLHFESEAKPTFYDPFGNRIAVF